MNIGDLEIHLISDGYVSVDAGGPFGLVPRVLYAPYIEPDEDNRVPETLTSLLIRSQGSTILVDTGLGTRIDERVRKRWLLRREHGDLLEGLAKLGLTPEDVDIVINTHLHSDHCAGNTRWEGERLVPTFPRATYLVQRLEWADASHPDARTRGTYFADNFAPLVTEGRMTLLHGDTQVTDHVRCVVTPGHTRGHQAVVLESQGWFGLYVSDMATFAIHMARSAWLTAFDVEPLENITTKAAWQRWALDRDAWLIFIHDPINPVARLVHDGGRLEVQPVGEAQPLIDSLPIPRPPPG